MVLYGKFVLLFEIILCVGSAGGTVWGGLCCCLG